MFGRLRGESFKKSILFGRNVCILFKCKILRFLAKRRFFSTFRYPYRAVGALVDGAFSAHQQHGRPGMMHHGGRPGRPSHPPMMGGGGHHVNNEDYLDSMLKRLFFKKLVSKFIEEEFLEDEDEDDDPMGPAVAGGDGGSMRAAMKYFKQQGGRYVSNDPVFQITFF